MNSPTENREGGLLFWLPVWTLAKREVVRFVRQRSRLVGAVGQPILFWILFGAGLRGSFEAPEWADREMSYQEYFFPGIAVLIVMFTAIFSTISIIEDRREGFLQGVLVAPASRLSIVLGKLFGGTALAVLQAGLFVLLAPAVQIAWTDPLSEGSLPIGNLAAALAFLVLLAFTLTALGYIIAWPLDSTQGFHAVMSVFLMPMWLLSGAFFPGGNSPWLAWVIRLNPLTYSVAGLRRLMSPGLPSEALPGLPALATCLTVTSLFCVVCVGIAVGMTCRRTSNDAR